MSVTSLLLVNRDVFLGTNVSNYTEYVLLDKASFGSNFGLYRQCEQNTPNCFQCSSAPI